MAVYSAAVVLGLQSIGFWTPSLLKETILWFFCSGLILAADLIDSGSKKPVLKTVVAKQVGVFVLVQFLVNTYTFSLPVELLLIPFAAAVAMLQVVADRDPQHAQAARLFSIIQMFIGFAVLGAAIHGAIGAYGELRTLNAVKQILIHPVLAFLFVPCLYTLVLFSSYQQLFVLLNVGSPRDRSVVRYAKRRFLIYFGANLTKLRRLTGSARRRVLRIRTREDVDQLLLFLESGLPEDDYAMSSQPAA